MLEGLKARPAPGNLPLHEPTEPVIVPAPRPREQRLRRAGPVGWRLPIWARLLLIILAACWVTVFVIAASLDPYLEDGTARTMETHRQLGLPECTFKVVANLPCPSCGMTTSFALLIRGDVWNSARANFAGTLLASLGIVFVPWSLASVWKGRTLYVRAIDQAAFWLALGFLIVIFGRWGVLLALAYSGYPVV